MPSTPTTLVSFNGSNGNQPRGDLLADAAGNLFGTTEGGGGNGFFGTVFEIARTGSGYASTPTTLARFNGTDGDSLLAGVIADAAGNLFGTTAGGGANGFGTVFEIAKTAGGYASTPTTLVSFNGSNGRNPTGSLLVDAAGNLFGTTTAGGAGGVNGSGTVFEIAKTSSGYASTPTTLVSFNGTNPRGPEAGLIADAAGNLFGTTIDGGAYNVGTVFEIAKTGGGYASAPTTLVSFNTTDGWEPFGGLIADAAGDLFGTATGGGAYGDGTVFEIAKTAGGYASTPTTLVSFNGSNGQEPRAGLLNVGDNLFGTTELGGSSGCGTIFEIVRGQAGSSGGSGGGRSCQAPEPASFALLATGLAGFLVIRQRRRT